MATAAGEPAIRVERVGGRQGPRWNETGRMAVRMVGAEKILVASVADRFLFREQFDRRYWVSFGIDGMTLAAFEIGVRPEEGLGARGWRHGASEKQRQEPALQGTTAASVGPVGLFCESFGTACRNAHRGLRELDYRFAPACLAPRPRGVQRRTG